ncbi:LVIVD repeat-containing protein [Nonomuraea rhizosphaerae]|uniref:LVIVD repeat-containing protein n=1 Tax=Nonomuraea rhizosphaerae TaxID=2665663 RepID=UPI0027E30BD0|nr:hypothetical protein [Nonomuraea rhizosphaerae]
MIFGKVRSVAACAATMLLLAACAAGPQPTRTGGTAGEPTPLTEPTGQGRSSSGSGATGDARTSPNVKLVAHLPRTAPLNGDMDWNTDLAFQGDYAFVGNFGGFSIFDISDPEKPVTVSQVACPAQQNDVTVHGDLLILSVDEPRSDETCTSTNSDRAWEGLRIFDVSDKKNPKYVSSVATECGSHTHTMVPDGEKLYVYVSSPGPEPESETCPPPHALLQVVEIPTKDPKSAKVVSKPNFLPDQGDGAGCHDITAYPEKRLAAAACFGEGVLLDISDPVHPKLIQQVRDEENFQLWHSATFNNDATKVVFGDELGGGGAPTCNSGIPATKGADAVYDLVNNKLERRGYFKIPREQSEDENCVAHNGSLLPVPGKDIMVQSWYQGGVSVWDFTDSAAPKEIGYYDPPPFGKGIAGSWSAYYYNGYIYSSEIRDGLYVLRIDDPLTDPAKKVRMDDFNVQTQKSY